MSSGVTLQINLAPSDLPTAMHTVPHQLRQWAAQVEEILFVLDLHRSPGRFSESWQERLPGMRSLIAEWCETHPHARFVDVDYAGPVQAEVGREFFGVEQVPAKDHRGAPFYAYFFGLHEARHRHVLHMDSDMLAGGGSQSWVGEAVTLMSADPSVLACNPLPGPPRLDGLLLSQSLSTYERLPGLAFKTASISTRIFIVDTQRLKERVAPIKLSKPRATQLVKALTDGHPPAETAELVISKAMAMHGLLRVDFLGEEPGMWSLHPLYRTPKFFERLPSLIADVEANRIPDGQRGFHELNDTMVDWSGARKPWPVRWARHLKVAASRTLKLAAPKSAKEA